MSRIDSMLQRPCVQDEAIALAIDCRIAATIAQRHDLTALERQTVARVLERAEGYLAQHLPKAKP